MLDLAALLRELADRVETLDVAQQLGELEAIRYRLWTQATPVPAAPPAPSNGLDVNAVAQRTGMSTEWVYREARAGRLPFARRLGRRRVVFDERGLARWLEHRPGQRRS